MDLNHRPIVPKDNCSTTELIQLINIFSFDEVLGQIASYSFEVQNTTLHLRFSLRPTVPRFKDITGLCEPNI